MATRRKQYGIPPEWMAEVRHWQHGIGPGHLVYPQVRDPQGPAAWAEVHPELEIGLMLSGQSRRYFLDYEFSVGPGEVWLTERWEPHGLSTDGPSSRVVLVFAPDFLGDAILGDLPWSQLFSAPPDQRPHVREEATRARVLALGEAMRAEILEKQLGWEAALRHYTLLLLLALRRTWTPSGLSGNDTPSRTALSRVMPALELVRKEPSRRISLSEAALACGLSISQFSRVFRGAMGMSFSRFDFDTRLTLASSLLRRTNLPTHAIAERTGFVDAGHLYRVFMDVLKVSPSDYRRQHADQDD